MLENDEVERTASEQGPTKAREKHIDRPYSILSSWLVNSNAANLTDTDYPALKETLSYLQRKLKESFVTSIIFVYKCYKKTYLSYTYMYMYI